MVHSTWVQIDEHLDERELSLAAPERLMSDFIAAV
jgi:hypothetical protein